jgi:ubiquitin carboxyl-terminal hydrolase 25
MFSLIVQYATAAQQYGEQIPEWFQQLIIDERERGRFTQDDIDRASQILGFGENGPLGVSLDDVDALFIVNAVDHALQTAAAKGLSARDIGDAFRIVAHTSGNRSIVETYERMAARGWMSVDDAYRTLGASKEVDDAMLIMAAQMQMADAPAQADKVREAIAFIAQARDSFRLRKFLEIGEDRKLLDFTRSYGSLMINSAGDILAPVRADLPRGLNQLGNTCYLNSLLQYFYTIKDLREAVLELSKTDPKSFDDGDAKLTEDNLKKVRVGGRNVTRREIARSRKCKSRARLLVNMLSLGKLSSTLVISSSTSNMQSIRQSRRNSSLPSWPL